MSRIRFDHVAEAKRPGPWVMPFKRLLRGVRDCSFNVNQVLVRLWARVIRLVLLDWWPSRCPADLSDRPA